MEGFKAFLKRKNIEISAKRYGIDALGAMAQGLFCSLLIGTIIKTLGQQLSIQYLIDIGAYAMAVSGPAMAVAIGYALKADPMVLFSLAAVGWAANAEGGAGGPLAVLIIAIIAAECGYSGHPRRHHFNRRGPGQAHCSPDRHRRQRLRPGH